MAVNHEAHISLSFLHSQLYINVHVTDDYSINLLCKSCHNKAVYRIRSACDLAFTRSLPMPWSSSFMRGDLFLVLGAVSFSSFCHHFGVVIG